MFTGVELILQWLVRFWEKRSNLLVKWIIDIPFFQANKSIFGRHIIIPHILTTIMTHGGITGGVTLITEDGGKKNTWGNDLPFFHDSFRSPADTFSPPSYFPLVLLISIFLPVIVASPGNLALRTCR